MSIQKRRPRTTNAEQDRICELISEHGNTFKEIVEAVEIEFPDKFGITQVQWVLTKYRKSGKLSYHLNFGRNNSYIYRRVVFV